MKDKLFTIGKVISVLVFILALSLMGMASGKPIMILAFAGFFVVLMFFIFQFVRRNQRHFEIISQSNPKLMKAFGGLIILVAIVLPVIIFANVQLFDLGTVKLGFGILALIVAITLVLISGGVFAVYLINKASTTKMSKILGYLLVIVLSALPALLVIPHDRSTTGIGSVYYVTVLVAVLSWWGITLYLNKE